VSGAIFKLRTYGPRFGAHLVLEVVRLRYKQPLSRGRIGSTLLEWGKVVKPEPDGAWGIVNGTIILDAGPGDGPLIRIPSEGLKGESDVELKYDLIELKRE
jgi:hypothetical protein